MILSNKRWMWAVSSFGWRVSFSLAFLVKYVEGLCGCFGFFSKDLV